MLSMLEKIKANAATLSKPPLGEAPLNLSAMLDNGHNKQNGSEGSSGNSGEVFLVMDRKLKILKSNLFSFI